MPELPEAHTIACSLEGRMKGHVLKDIVVRDATALTGHKNKSSVPSVQDYLGRKICRVSRWGKAVALELEEGRKILVKLGMTGQLLWGQGAAESRVVFHTSGGIVCYKDRRRLGRIELCQQGSLPLLGVDALSPDFNQKTFYQRLRHRTASIKSLLLDQGFVSGIGNIYATEALFLAGIRPAKKGGALSPAETGRLVQALQAVLKKGIRYRGSSIATYVDALGRPGTAQRHFAAYGRQGKPCKRCQTELKKITIGGRGSVFCPKCQH